MTTNEVRAAAAQLLRLHQRFAPCFGRKEAQAQARIYLEGLLLAPGRKSAEPMALVFGEPDDDGINQNQVLALQRFLTYSPWDAHAVQREIQTVFAEQFVPSTSAWSIGTVGVIDESAFVKKGTHSVGVERQYCGRLGKTDNCQVGVFVVGVTPAGSALLEHQLYLPKSWADDGKRRAETSVPGEVEFQTKSQIALDLLRRVRSLGWVRFDWVIADEHYSNGDFLDDLEALPQRYVVEVRANTTVWTVDPQTQVPPHRGRGRRPRRPTREHLHNVRALAASLPPSAWQVLALRSGSNGPLAFAFARLRVWPMRNSRPGPASWLLLRRPLEPDAEVKYYLSNAAADEPMETLALVSGTRFRVEEFFEDSKSHLGMAQYEARAWSSWHHHMSLVGLAHLFVSLTRLELKKNSRVDVGHGRPLAHQRPGQADVERIAGHRDRGVPPGTQSSCARSA